MFFDKLNKVCIMKELIFLYFLDIYFINNWNKSSNYHFHTLAFYEFFSFLAVRFLDIETKVSNLVLTY